MIDAKKVIVGAVVMFRELPEAERTEATARKTVEKACEACGIDLAESSGATTGQCHCGCDGA